jgi:protein O-mannosyl-transferase
VRERARAKESGNAIWSGRIAGWIPPILVLAIFWSSLRNGFVNLDDPIYLFWAPYSQNGIGLQNLSWAFSATNPYWHPLTWVSHMMDCQIFGFGPAGHHFISVLLHSANAALLYLLMKRTTGRTWESVACAVLYAVHPLRVESVAWVAERKDLLSGFFILLTLLTYVKFVERGTPLRYAALLAAFACALMSKPSSVVFPLLCLLLDYWPLCRRLSLASQIREKAPLFALSGLVGVITFLAQERAGALDLLGHLPASTRLANAVVSIAIYLAKTVWPFDLACHYPYRANIPGVEIVVSACVFAAITTLAIWQRKRRPYLPMGWMWFVACLLPTLGIVQAGRQAYADRFAYLASIGPAIAVVWTAADWAEGRLARQRILLGGLAAAATVLVILTVKQVDTWRDSITLFEHGIAVTGPNEYLRGNLATSLMEKGRYVEAEQHLLEAIRIAPAKAAHHHNLARVYLELGQLGRADASAETAVKLSPGQPQPRYLRALIWLKQGRIAEGLTGLEESVGFGLDSREAATTANDFGVSLARQGRLAEAERLLRAAVRWFPALGPAQKNLILVLLDQGRKPEAISQLHLARSVNELSPELRLLATELGVK